MFDSLNIMCVKGKKIGDSLIKLEDKSVISIYPDTHYEREVVGFWMLEKVGYWWKIIRFLRARDVKI